MLISQEKALHCSGGHRRDAIWAACYTSTGLYLAVWGARGTKYQTLTKPFNNIGTAQREFTKKVQEKLGKGYYEVSFAAANYGNIPSFGNATLQGTASSAHLITPDSLLADLNAFTEKLQSADQPALLLSADDSLRIKFAQLKLKSEVLLLEMPDGAESLQHRSSQLLLKERADQMQSLFLELETPSSIRRRSASVSATTPDSASYVRASRSNQSDNRQRPRRNKLLDL